MLRIFFAAALILATMVAIKDGRVLREAGLTGSCTPIVAPAGDDAVWEACRPGKLEGRPDLGRRSCVAQSRQGEIEYWRCPAAVGSGHATG